MTLHKSFQRGFKLNAQLSGRRQRLFETFAEQASFRYRSGDRINILMELLAHKPAKSAHFTWKQKQSPKWTPRMYWQLPQYKFNVTFLDVCHFGFHDAIHCQPNFSSGIPSNTLSIWRNQRGDLILERAASTFHRPDIYQGDPDHVSSLPLARQICCSDLITDGDQCHVTCENGGTRTKETTKEAQIVAVVSEDYSNGYATGRAGPGTRSQREHGLRRRFPHSLRLSALGLIVERLAA